MEINLEALAHQSFFFLPPVFVSIIGILVVIRKRAAARRASSWALAALNLVIIAVLETYYVTFSGSDLHEYFVVPLTIAASYVLFLIALYSGRQPENNPSDYIWGPIVRTLKGRPGLKGLAVTLGVLVLTLGVVISAVVSFLLPECYCAIAQLRLRYVDTNSSTAAAIKSFEPQFMKTESFVAKSSAVLEKVATKLQLPERWGKLYYEGKPLTTPETLSILKNAVRVRPKRNSSILEIEVHREAPAEAAEIANSLANVYMDFCQTKSGPQPVRAYTEAQVISPAKPPLKPYTPNKPIVGLLGTWLAAWIGLLTGLTVIWIESKKPIRNSAVADAGLPVPITT